MLNMTVGLGCLRPIEPLKSGGLTLTVDDLRKTLANIPGDREVLICLEDDEFGATCITVSRNCLRICKTDADVTTAETVLHRDGE